MSGGRAGCIIPPALSSLDRSALRAPPARSLPSESLEQSRNIDVGFENSTISVLGLGLGLGLTAAIKGRSITQMIRFSTWRTGARFIGLENLP